MIADYSSRGPTWFDGFAKPDVVAPGHRLVSAANSVADALYVLPDAAADARRPRLR